jgi:hypothetical protein
MKNVVADPVILTAQRVKSERRRYLAITEITDNQFILRIESVKGTTEGSALPTSAHWRKEVHGKGRELEPLLSKGEVR